MQLSPEQVGQIIAQSRFDVNEEIAGSHCMRREMKWFSIKKWSYFLIANMFGLYQVIKEVDRASVASAFRIMIKPRRCSRKKISLVTLCGNRASDPGKGNCSGIQAGTGCDRKAS
jgi:hypothetical protein